MLDLSILDGVYAETLPEGRTYYTPEGAFPSITTLLGKTANQEWLVRWKKKSRRRRSK